MSKDTLIVTKSVTLSPTLVDSPSTVVESVRIPFWNRPIAFVTLAALVFLTVFFRLGSYGLIDADEGRYASIPREMLARGDWVIPTLNGAEFFDKPVLLYWSEMLTFSAFGVNELAARLAPALWSLAAIVAVYALSRRTFGQRAAFLSTAILGTTVMWPVMGRTVITDTPLASLTTLALCFWWLGHTEREIQGANRRTLWFALFWVSLGLGVLTKGPIALLLCFGAIIPYLTWCRPQKGWKMGAWWGIPLMILVAAPWFVLIQMREPEFGRLFWWEQNFARFLGSKGVPDHWESPYYFLPLLPAIFFPWSVFMPLALTQVIPIFRRARWSAELNLESNEKARAVVFLIFGATFTLLFFSVSKSKIVTYIAPMVPLVSVLLGAYIDAQWENRRPKIEAGVLAVLALVVGIGALVYAPRAVMNLGIDSAGFWVGALGAIMLVWAASLAVSCLTSKTQWVFTATAGGFALFLATAVSFWCALAPTLTTEPLLTRLRPALSPDAQVASVGFIQSVPFYTHRRVAVDGVRGGHDGTDLSKIPDELLPAWEEMGQTERTRYFYGESGDLEKLMTQNVPVFVIARNSRLTGSWDDLDEEMYILAANKRYTLVGNRKAWEQFEKSEAVR
ncbi:undecaprenyl phosphate-alpha-4-amino-4-deoxy-L-arabinose arabinosyl transferase [Abditibacteriota bacterium]|nr:undecaprenyl phosphate-alpha-4-amino-4-deoxy-L-arabinose arabinosyl transferase [Abditibacteriota bacterium]